MSVTYYSNPNATRPGLVYIFNYTRFKRLTVDERKGSFIDRDLLKDLFESLNFNPKDIHVKEDLTASDLFKCISDIMKLDHFYLYRSLWIFIMTDGYYDFLHATDLSIHMNHIKLALTSNTHWIGIPKLLVVQACRGCATEEGLLIKGDFCDGRDDVEVDDEAVDYNIPATSDTIYFNSTWQGFVSFRSVTEGSPFIRYFAENMKRHFYSDDIVKIFTKVCRDVGYNFSAEMLWADVWRAELKQIPCFEHSFMSKLYFGLDLKESEKHERIQLERYNMGKQYSGLVLFFYQKNHSNASISDRCADDDAERLKPLLNSFGFKVQVEVDKTETEVREILETTSNQDFSEYGSLMIIFSGHGTVNMFFQNKDALSPSIHKLFFKEGSIFTNEIWDPFTTVKTLVGKPKLFLISACRGGLHDEGSMGDFVLPTSKAECVNASNVVTKYQTSSTEPHTIPNKADILVVFASATDYVSIVDVRQKGTFFLIELYNVLSQLKEEENIMDILYRLNESLAKQITKNLQAEKQMSFVLSSLTKELYFPKRVQSEL